VGNFTTGISLKDGEELKFFIMKHRDFSRMNHRHITILTPAGDQKNGWLGKS
jgi:hypothetical protein